MSARRATLLLLSLCTLGPARDAGAYAGLGRAAVERAIGTVPETEDDLDRRIEELKRSRSDGDLSAATAYSTGILLLNRPRSYETEEPRRVLADAVAEDPAYLDALAVWLDLLPPDDELRELEARLAARPADAAGSWALGNIAARLGKDDDAVRLALAAEAADAAYRSRSRWLQAQVAAEDRKDEDATRLFGEALEALDEPAIAVIWETSLLVASPEEIARFKTVQTEGPREFLQAFWKRRDVFPLTPTNERLGEHFRRMERARTDYRVSSNGRAYLSTHDTFKEQSPDLAFYSSDVVYDAQERVGPWIDHRGIIFVRHGDPDRAIRTSQNLRAETWYYNRFTFKPLLFHLVDRRGVGEFVLTLNLAQATAVTAIEDDPKQILQNSSDFRDVYGTRAIFHPLFQRISVSRSNYEVEDLLYQEAALMAGFIREVWYDDTNTLIKKDDLLPFAAYSANFMGNDRKVDAFVYYAIPERELKMPGTSFDFDATIVIYNKHWSHQVASAEHHFHFDRPAGSPKPGKQEFLVGAMQLPDLEPDRYNFAFQVTERSSGKIGIAKGLLIADYYGPEWVEMSDLLLAGEIEPTTAQSIFERNGQRVVPIPTRTIPRGDPAKVYYEIYDLAPGADGKTHYRVEYRVLQVQQEPSVASKVLGVGMNVASAFFPYQIFLARVAQFGLGVAATDPNKGLDIKIEERSETPTSGVVSQVYDFDTKKYPDGIYQVYVTVKDYVSGSVTTRSVRFAIDK